MRLDTLVWREGMPQWLPAEQVPELREMLGGSTGAPPPPPPAPGYGQPQYGHPHQQYGYAPPANSNKIAAGVCGILLGWLGVHKFILGMTGPGLVMLLVSLIGGVITCGVASAVVSIIGIVEGIIYLTKTDQEFHQIYEIEKRPWF